MDEEILEILAEIIEANEFCLRAMFEEMIRFQMNIANLLYMSRME